MLKMQVLNPNSVVNIYSLSVVFAVFFIFVVIDLVRRDRLLEKYSMLWLFFSVVIILFASSPQAVNHAAESLDIKYAPSLLFFIGVVFLIVYTLHITTVISRQNDRIVRLTQEIAILKQTVSINTREEN
jgi:hypothetical protein